ncbi:hypothetical protein BOTNAR_0148g00100 [Botryotinia narcissicola]|uniref:Uncharacterized protein n=1 Tax=Botryotinia narcissicola TaxID=278944 RepID=A0A4Z1IL70_9HELO|nr:hypothetical protein BOTNAR_0148g00100 [Botryotinia narcissicola]
MAKTHRIFQEPRDGIVAHTSISKAIATIPLVESWLGLVTDEIWPAFTRMVDAIEEWSDSQEPNETGYNLATNQFDAYFEGMKKSTHREKRFADVITFFHAGGKWERAELIEHYNWEIMSEGLVVELGGMANEVCLFLGISTPVANSINRGSDFTMKSCLNGRERDADEWDQLFEKADSRFKLQGIAAVPNSRFSVIEAIWEDGSAPGLRRT